MRCASAAVLRVLSSFSQPFGDEGQNEAVEADSFGFARRRACRIVLGIRWMNLPDGGFRSGLRLPLRRGTLRPYRPARGSSPQSIPAVLYGLLLRLPIGHAAWKVGEGNKIASAVFLAQRATTWA